MDKLEDVLQSISKTFWSTSVWLPPNTTWEEIQPGARPDVVYPDYRHLAMPIPLALVILAVRMVVER